MATVLDGHPCPECQRLTAYPLESLNREALVDYYRCSVCGHVWTAPKSDHQQTSVPRQSAAR